MSEPKRSKPRRHIEPIFKSVSPGGVGSIPGTPLYIGDKAPTEAAFSLIQYDHDEISFVTPESIEEVLAMLEDGMVNWVNVNGLADQDALKRLGGFFRLDSLTIEDVLNTEHRPKIEDFGRYLLVITKMLTKRPDDTIEYEQVSIIITSNSVLTIQESPGDCFDPVRERLRSGTGRLRRFGPSFLAYALLDVIVDHYFSLLEWLGNRLEDFEATSASARDAAGFMTGLQDVKADLNRFRRTVWPVRDTVVALAHSDSDLLEEALTPFLRDLQDNAVQVIEAIESYRETASGIHEVFLSSVSNRMNEVMKVLTIISTIFIPLTFIAGVYGMNFKYMPELDKPWAYPVAWGLMISIALGMIVFFKRKKWF
ncbi:MAG: magnesium and cobalt transport protein CorA [Spirochaetae bacterium HGW-Spirochaetae-3]|jgi:magnesium transporter|nr:MAG: magnesium and cobalt transport protein CorA [Spirochaetae bacterium HGW-Spirochaetae-3]